MASDDHDEKFEALLDYLKRSRGFDFTGYKRMSLIRRVTKRMDTVEIKDFGDYTDFLQVHPEEFTHLFNTILINVTDFFRDAPAWEFLRSDIIPKLIAARPDNAELRIWCAGVASGEEAFTTAMLFAEALGPDALLERVKIYATDVDDEALNQARSATYSAEHMESVPPELRKRYFEMVGGHYLFRADCRRAVVFGRHDLIQDAPISRLDLLICRNTLMYFNIEAQSRILSRFHFALRDEGYLFLGRAEMLLTHSNLFTPVDLRHRIFARVPTIDARERMLMGNVNAETDANDRTTNFIRLREAALNTSQTAMIVVDLNRTLVMANNRARALFGLSGKELGRTLGELEVSYRPVELRSRIDQVYAERRSISVPGVRREQANQSVQYFDIDLTPLQDNDGTTIGASIAFSDVTKQRELQDDLTRSRQDLETAYEELQSANEELETTNEELQSTIEELQTTNEELQSSNEELETMNEELQSTNEEQETTNTELRRRTDEGNEANAFLGSILASLRAAVIVVDRNLNVLVWNREAEQFWGLRSEEVLGHSFFNLDIGMPVDRLHGPIRACIAGNCSEDSLLIDGMNRRGKPLPVRVTISPLTGVRGELRGAILLIEEEKKE